MNSINIQFFESEIKNLFAEFNNKLNRYSLEKGELYYINSEISFRENEVEFFICWMDNCIMNHICVCFNYKAIKDEHINIVKEIINAVKKEIEEERKK